MRQQGIVARKDFLDDEDLEVRLEGFPPEVAEALNAGADWVQMNPENTFVMQSLKEDWARYAIPIVATCLRVSQEGVDHAVRVLASEPGRAQLCACDLRRPEVDIMPDITQLNAVNSLFRRADDRLGAGDDEPPVQGRGGAAGSQRDVFRR